MKKIFTSELLPVSVAFQFRKGRKYYLDVYLLAFLLFSLTFSVFPQSESIQKAIDTYKKNFYVWKEPEATQPTTDSILTVLGRWAWGPCNAADAKGNFAYIGNGPTFHILDISDPTSPEIIGEYLTDGYIYDLEVRDNVAFVCAGGEFYFIDISNPSTPELISYIEISGVAISFALEGSFVYVTTFIGVMTVVDISDLNNPFLRDSISVGGELAVCVEAKNSYVYVGNLEWPILVIINATNPDSLTGTSFDIEGRGISAFIRDTLLFIGSSWYSTYLKIYDISNLAEPEFVGHVEIDDSVLIDGITISEDGLTAYLLCLTSYVPTFFTEGIYSIDISDLNQPVIIDKYGRETQASARGISIAQNTLVASYYSGLCVLDASEPNNLQLQSFFPTGGFAEKIQVKDSLAFVASGLSGLWILNVSDPYKPRSVSNVNTGSFTSDLVVEDTLAYIINWPAYSAYVGGDTSRGLWIIDISNIYQPKILSHYIGISNSTNRTVASSITKSGNLILITQAPTATSIDIMELIDVSNVFQPSRVGIFQSNTDPYDITVKDTIVYLATDAGLKIIDISDPENPVEISSILTSARGVTFHNPYIYTSTYVFSIINVDDPSNPFLVSSISTQSSSQGRRDLTALGNYAYWAEYYLGIIDISNPENPIQITTFLGKDVGRGVAVKENKIYFADQTMGVWIIGNNLITDVKENVHPVTVIDYKLYQNYPNPFNPTTQIKYSVVEDGLITLKVYDILGRETATLVNEEKPAGTYIISFDASNLSSGIYFYSIIAGDFHQTKKMILLK